MKLPALWILAAFAAGILLAGPLPPTPPIPMESGQVNPPVWLALAVAALLAALGLLRRKWNQAAFIAALISWLFLGALAARLQQVARPANHITNLLAEGRLDTSEALRWRGRLRSDPVRLPWGLRYDLDVEEVEASAARVPATGGLRISYFHSEGEAEAPAEVRAGNTVEALVRARAPRNFRNPGAFDFRDYLARQGIHLTGSLRNPELLRKISEPHPDLAHATARLRGRLLARLDTLFPGEAEQAAVLRAMLLGDYNFVDHELAERFQKTAAYHVLVISGFQVAVLAAMVFWVGRRLRLGMVSTTLLTVAVLAAFVAVVEDQPPIQRATVMVAVFLASRLFFRRVELLNTVGVAALLLLIARPSGLTDASFQLSFVAVGMIGALALPWVERTSGPYRRALRHLPDVTRDAAHTPRTAQFRLDLRAAAEWLEARLPRRLAARASLVVTAPCRAAFVLWEVLLVSATIQFGMLPLLAHYFHRVSPVGPLANIPATVLSGVVVPLGFLTLGVSGAWAGLGEWLARVLGALAAALVGGVVWFSNWSWASYRIPRPPAWLLASFFAVLVLMALAARARHPALREWQLLLALPLAGLALAVATYPFAPDLERGKLELAVLDVGQGDSIFAAFPDGRAMLMDGGGMLGAGRIGGMRTGFDIGEQVVSPYLWYRGLKRLDVVALTHAHQDHLDGLKAVLENFRVRELWVGREVESPAYRALVELARARGISVRHRIRGEEFAWGGVSGRILWPAPTCPDSIGIPSGPDSSVGAEAPKNNDSLVLRLEHGRLALLLTGDIERAVESELVARGASLRADFLKVAHHGSKTSTSAQLLAEVAPRVAVISAGETNPFGHPHPDVLERLRASHVRVLRTDRDGAVTAVSDGQTLRVRGYAEAR